jgi:hypothetical protein
MVEENVEQERGITIKSNEELDLVEEVQELSEEEDVPLGMLESDAELFKRIRETVEQAPTGSKLEANAIDLLYQLENSRNMKFLIGTKYTANVKRFLKDGKYAANIRKQATQRLGSSKKFAFPALSTLNKARVAFDEGSKTKQFKVFEAAFYTVVESSPTQKIASAISRILFSCNHLKNPEFPKTDAGVVITGGIKDVVKFYSN